MSSAAVIILNYNGAHFLKKFLPSVVAHSQGHRLIVADNASTDHSLSFLAEEYPQVEVLSFDQNHGFAQGYNLALQNIDNPYSVLLNSDVEVTVGWIAPVLDAMERDPRVVAAQPKVRSYHQPNYFEHAGAAGGYIDYLGYPFCRGRIVDHLEPDAGQYDDPVPVFWASGACFFVRTEVFRQLGGFDPLFHAHMEEIDLCWRLQAANYKICYEPRSVVLHVGGGTMPATNPRKTYLNFRNSTGMLYKNTPRASLWPRVLLKLGLDGVAALRFLLQGKRPDAQAVLRAVLDFARQYRAWKRSRSRVAQKLGSAPVMMPRLLVVERYLRGKKLFSALNFRPRD
jgi:GT2 family glycosyltransferase